MKKKILVVDDEAGLTRMIKANLERTGKYEVRTENMGSRAMAAAREFRPDLMFLDVMMPDMSGDDVAARLADLAATTELVRTTGYQYARMLDRPDLYGPRWTPEMLARTRVTKLFVSDQLTRVANQVMDLMGAYGYSRDGEVEKHWRDSKIMSLWMGGRALPQLDIARWFFDAEGY